MSMLGRQASLSMEIFPTGILEQNLQFPTPGDWPHPGTEPASPMYPALQTGFFNYWGMNSCESFKIERFYIKKKNLGFWLGTGNKDPKTIQSKNQCQD